MSRYLIIGLAVIFLCVGSATAAEVDNYGQGTVVVTDHTPGASGDTRSAAGNVGDLQYYAFYMLGWTGDRWCRIRRVTTDAELAAAYNYRLQREFASGNAPGNADECPSNAVPVPVLPTPDVLARDFWDVRILPAPQLHMSPDYAVTGKPVYLEIGGDQSLHFDVPNPIGPAIAIDTASRYLVDWGDGTVETTTSRGGPWPDGDLTHVYTTSAPERTIRVTQQWSATWRAGPDQGALDTLQTGGQLAFRVTQVQAVRN